MVKTMDCGSIMRGFESHHPPHKKDSDFCYCLFYSEYGEDEKPPFCGLNERAKCGAVLLVAHLQLKARRGVTSMASEVTESHHPPHNKDKHPLRVRFLFEW